MDVYLVNLIENPELRDKGLEELLASASDKLIHIPETNVPLTIGRSPYSDITIENPNLKKSYFQRFKEFYHDLLRKLKGRKRIKVESNVEEKIWQSVSSTHCMIYNEGSFPYVEDLKSKNGTFVNRIPVNTTGGVLLNDGDRLCVGPMVFKVLFETRYRGLANRVEYANGESEKKNYGSDLNNLGIPSTETHYKPDDKSGGERK